MWSGTVTTTVWGQSKDVGYGWGQLRVFPDRTEGCGYLGRTPPRLPRQPALILELELTHSHQGMKAWESGRRRSTRAFLSYPIHNTHAPCPQGRAREELKPPGFRGHP